MANSCRILVVEDNEDTARSLMMLLELKGHSTTWASNGQSGLEFAENHEYDVALLDLGLPKMDGYELARRLRELGKPLCIIAITGYGDAASRARSAAAGIDTHLLKPTDPLELLKLLDELCLDEVRASAGVQSK
jgi:CheY-like chemotaxis protein